MRLLSIVITTVALACGCARSSGPPTYEVTGRVTWGGAALEDGDIIFTAADNAVVPAAGKINLGTYRLQAFPGPKKVSIRASRLVPGSKGANGEPIFDNFIPDQYNVATILTADVKTEGENRFDFALEKERSAPGK